MTSDQSPIESSNSQNPPQQEMGLMLQRRALQQMERAQEKPRRSPKQIAIVSLAVLITMILFLAFIDKGVKVTHRVLDIWTPVILDTKKTDPMPLDISPPPKSSGASSSEAAYMIKVEPTPPSPANASSSNSQSSKN